MLTYLTSSSCKAEHTMSELMKKPSKESYEKDIKGKMLSIGNTFLTKCKVSTHEAIKRVFIIFTYEAFKYRCSVCSYLSKNE